MTAAHLVPRDPLRHPFTTQAARWRQAVSTEAPCFAEPRPWSSFGGFPVIHLGNSFWLHLDTVLVTQKWPRTARVLVCLIGENLSWGDESVMMLRVGVGGGGIAHSSFRRSPKGKDCKGKSGRTERSGRPSWGSPELREQQTAGKNCWTEGHGCIVSQSNQGDEQEAVPPPLRKARWPTMLASKKS